MNILTLESHEINSYLNICVGKPIAINDVKVGHAGAMASMTDVDRTQMLSEERGSVPVPRCVGIYSDN